MPFAENDGVRIHFEETGKGTPLVFLHEFGGDHRSWHQQMGYFGRHYRCIVVSARGYPPSDVPSEEDGYGQELANADALAVLDHLGIGKTHVVGLSMGAYTALQLALHAPDRLLSVVAASGGSGAYKPTRAGFETQTLAVATQMDETGVVPGEAMGSGPARIQLKHKDPAAWAAFAANLSGHPAHAAAKTLRQIQVKRASLYDLEDDLRAITTPVLLMVGDEDEACLDVNLYLKRLMASAQLAVMPQCGHLLNLEEPALFAQLIERFLASVDRGTWRPRDASAMPGEGTATAMGLGDAGKK